MLNKRLFCNFVKKKVNTIQSGLLIALLLVLGISGFILFLRGILKNRTRYWIIGLSILVISFIITVLYAVHLVENMMNVKTISVDANRYTNFIIDEQKLILFQDEQFVFVESKISDERFRLFEIFIHEHLKRMNVIEEINIIDTNDEKLAIEFDINSIFHTELECIILNNVYETVYNKRFIINTNKEEKVLVEFDIINTINTDEFKYVLIQINNSTEDEKHEL